MCVYIHTYICVCVLCVCVCVNIHMRISIHRHASHASDHLYAICIYTYMYIHTYMCLCEHTHAYKHTHSCILSHKQKIHKISLLSCTHFRPKKEEDVVCLDETDTTPPRLSARSRKTSVTDSGTDTTVPTKVTAVVLHMWFCNNGVCCCNNDACVAATMTRVLLQQWRVFRCNNDACVAATMTRVLLQQWRVFRCNNDVCFAATMTRVLLQQRRVLLQQWRIHYCNNNDAFRSVHGLIVFFSQDYVSEIERARAIREQQDREYEESLMVQHCVCVYVCLLRMYVHV
jgi:hypothetical protein